MFYTTLASSQPVWNEQLSFGENKISREISAHKPYKQDQINQICIVLNQYGIRSKAKLDVNLEGILSKIIMENPRMLKHRDEEKCFEIFNQAVRAYQRVQETIDPILLNHQDKLFFYKSLMSARVSSSQSTSSKKEDPALQELQRITRSYDRLERSKTKIEETQKQLEDIMKAKEYIAVSHVILGSGDAGVTLWLEKYAPYHQKMKEKIAQKIEPDVLMIGQDMGNWKHDYVLAQPHNLLERENVKSNPKDFISQKSYVANLYVNAKHLHQSNIVNLAKTNAPLMLNMTVLKIEKKENHLEDWQSQEHSYRLVIQDSNLQEKLLYTHEIDICTGLGNAKRDFPVSYMQPREFENLSHYDFKRKFTPLINGDQFILTDSEEQSPERKTIVLYGGGGTATATYRKAFFGHDRSQRNYSEENQKNDVFWISSNGLERAGKGTLATAAIESAQKLNVLFCGILKQITFNHEKKKLDIYFKLNPEEKDTSKMAQQFTKIVKSHQGEAQIAEEEWYKISCDQFIFSMGQEAKNHHHLYREIKEHLEFDSEPNTQIPLGMKTTDGKVHFFGAAAQAIGEKIYVDAMRKWIERNKINDDSAATSVMPPSRAMIKMHALKGKARIRSINVNIDDIILIRRLLEESHVSMEKREPFIADIIKNRKQTASGMTHQRLQEILDQYQLNDQLIIKGHNFLMPKKCLPLVENRPEERASHLPSPLGIDGTLLAFE